MFTKRLSTRSRVFISMVLLILISSVLIGIVTVIQYNEQSNEYNAGRLERKEAAILRHFELSIDTVAQPLSYDLLKHLLLENVEEVSQVHDLELELYDLQGDLLISSNPSLPATETRISEDILQILRESGSHRFVIQDAIGDKEYQSSYTYLNDGQAAPVAILHIPYLENRTEQENELREFLSRLALGFFIMFIIGMAFALFISRYITRSIIAVSEKMARTRLHKRNQKIYAKASSTEIQVLIDAYNSMVDDLEESAVKLAQSEREEAWREMAKQVAHEIKNPLTPMRLTMQSFERRFDKDDPEIEIKIKEFSKTMIQQIDVMSTIASAFSDFAKMPTQKRERINLVEVVKHATEIFTEQAISFQCDSESIIMNLDKLQVTRIVTNLIKNAIQATEKTEQPVVLVQIQDQEKEALIVVTDNGKGIEEALKEKVFEPKFTTKTSGMGLGLPMIKNIIEAYDGTISFTSEAGKGTVFTVTLPKDLEA